MAIKIFVLENSKNKKTRRDSVQKAVREYLCDPKVKIVYDEKGRASVEGASEPKFISVTCCGDVMLAALASAPVGIDGEYIPRLTAEDNKVDYLALSERFFSDEENDYVRDDPSEAAMRFAKIWIRKEAYVKCTGKTLADFPSFSVAENGKLLNRIGSVPVKRFAIKIPNVEDYLFFIAGVD